MNFAHNIKQLRIREGKTQHQFADMLYISQSRLGHWETGRHIPLVVDLIRISQLLHVSIDDLIFKEL